MKARKNTPKTLLISFPKKNRPHLKHLILLAAATGSLTSARAAVLTKADNTYSLNTAGSYTNASATPTNADTVVFDSTFTQTATISVSGASIRALRILDPTSDVTINVGSSLFGIGVNNGTSGSIDLSSATKDLTINGSGGIRMYGSSPTITVALGRTLTISSALAIYNNGTLKIEGAGAVVFSGVVKDTNTSNITSIAYNGTGTLMLSGANTFSGNLAISSGTVKVGSVTALGASTNVVSVASGAVLDLNGTTMTNTNALTLNGTGSAGGALVNSNATAATYAGLVTLGSDSSIIAGSGDIVLSNAGTITGSGFGLTVGGSKNTTISSNIGTGAGTLTKQGDGTLTLAGSNTYTGNTTVSGGTLALTSGGSIAHSAKISVQSGATFDVSARGSAYLITSGQTLANTGTVKGDFEISGVVENSGAIEGSLTIKNSGKFVSESTSISGDLTVESGSLLSMTLDSLSSSKITVDGSVSIEGGTLDLTLGTVSVGDSYTIIDATSVIAGYFENVVITSSTIALSNTSASIFTVGTTTYELNYDNVNNDVTLMVLAVPEPSTWALMVGGLGALLALQRRGRRQSFHAL